MSDSYVVHSTACNMYVVKNCECLTEADIFSGFLWVTRFRWEIPQDGNQNHYSSHVRETTGKKVSRSGQEWAGLAIAITPG